MSYKVKFLNDEEFDALPGRNMEDKLGVAYPDSKEAYVRETGVPVIDVFNMVHELEHLEGDKLGEHYDADNQCYYKSKSNFFSKIGGAVKKALPIAAPIAAAFIPGVGAALGGLGSAISSGLGAISPALGGAASSIGGALGNVGAGIGSLFGMGQGGQQPQSQNFNPSLNLAGGPYSVVYDPNQPPQLSQQQLLNSPYRQGAPGFQTNPYGSYPGQSTQGMAMDAAQAGEQGGARLTNPFGQQGGFFQNFQNNLGQRLLNPNVPWYQRIPPPIQPVYGQPRTGINTGDTQRGGSLLDMFGLGDPKAFLEAIGVVGAGEFMNKRIKMPDFMSQPHVKTLSEWSNTANHPMDPNVRDAIQRTLDIQNEQQIRNLRNVYKNFHPGADYTSDYNYQRDYERLNRNMAMQGADAMAGAQFTSNAQNIDNLRNLAQLGVGQNLGQAAIDAQRQASRNRLFGNVGSMLGYKGIFGNQGPGFGAANPFSGMLGQGGP